MIKCFGKCGLGNAVVFCEMIECLVKCKNVHFVFILENKTFHKTQHYFKKTLNISQNTFQM